MDNSARAQVRALYGRSARGRPRAKSPQFARSGASGGGGGGATISWTRARPAGVRASTHSRASNGHSSMQMPQYMHSDQSMAKRSSTCRVRSRDPGADPHRLGMRVNADAPGRAFSCADHAGRAGRFDQPDPSMRRSSWAHVRRRRPAADRRLGHLRRVRRGLRGIAIAPNAQGPGRPEAPNAGDLGEALALPWLLGSWPVHPGTRGQHFILAQRRSLELRVEQQPTALAPDELNTEQLGHLPLMPRRTGKDTSHDVEPRIIAGQRAAQHPRLGPLGQIPQHQNHPQTIRRPISSTQPSQSK